MSNLANILAPSSNLPFPDSEPSELSSQDHGGNFDDAMSQALMPAPQNSNSSPASRNGTRSKIQPLNQNNPAVNQPENDENRAPVAAKASSTPNDSTPASVKSAPIEKDAKTKDATTDASQSGTDLYNPQNIPIQFLAPNLSALLLQPTLVPTPAKAGSSASDVSKDLIKRIGSTQTDSTPKGAVNKQIETGKNSAALAATATDSAQKVATALKNLGLAPVVVDSTPAKADKIAGANLSTAKNDLPPENTEKPENAGKSVKIEARTATISAGTADANEVSPMKKADTTNQAAGQTEKVLPGASISSARISNLPRVGSALASSHDLPAATNIIPISSALDRINNASNSPDPVAVTNLSDVQARAMERTHDMVTMNAIRLVNTQADSMQIVLKPGAGTQLSLELRQRGDVIEAQAILQQGDYHNLNQHWPDLQQRLEQKGIKLSVLDTDENAMTFGGQQGHSQNQSSTPEQDALYASAFAEFSLAGPVTGISAPAAAAGGRGSWESWA